MCLVVPLKVIKKKTEGWLMEDGRKVKLVLTEEVKTGDYLICQQDLAVEKIAKTKALKMRQALKGAYGKISKRD
jgi:hydrogenase maturation factor